MHKTKKKLRQDFYAVTDTKAGPMPGDWKKYAEWLENLAIKKINNKIIKENQFLRDKMQEAIDILENSITASCD